MSKPYFKIGGVDILPYIAQKGLKWQRNDVDGKNAGRTMDGTMHRDRIASKIRWDVSIIPADTQTSNLVLNQIYPEYVEVETNIDPQYGTYKKTFYSNNNPATCISIDDKTGAAMWEGITFPLIER